MKDITKLTKLFEQYAHGENYSTAFAEMLDHVLITFKFYETDKEQIDALYQLTNYKKKHTALLTEIGELSEGFEDPLGGLYQQILSKGQHGQYFTPNPIASLLASVVAIDSLKPGQTVCDPACGSGRLLLETANRGKLVV